MASLCSFFAGQLVHRWMWNTSRFGANRVPLQPPDILLRTGGETRQNCTQQTVAWITNSQPGQRSHSPQGKVKHKDLFFVVLLPGPLTATTTGLSLPPAGSQRYYVSGLRYVGDQLCCRPHLHLQEEVIPLCHHSFLFFVEIRSFYNVRKFKDTVFPLKSWQLAGIHPELMQICVPLVVAGPPTTSPPPSTWV